MSETGITKRQQNTKSQGQSAKSKPRTNGLRTKNQEPGAERQLRTKDQQAKDQPKHIYLIRHAETKKNRTRIHQGPEEPLTNQGKEQAHAVAEFLAEKGIDALITSDYVRARDTAAIIGERLDLPYRIEKSVREFRRPRSLYGSHHYSLKSLGYIWNLYRHRMDPDWDNEGAENMFQVRNRIQDAKRMLRETSGDTIAVISHAIFMDMFAEIICYERPLTLSRFIHGLIMSKKVPNTGIIHVSYNPDATKGQCAWTIEDILPSPEKK